MSVLIELVDFTFLKNETLNRLLFEKFSHQRKMFSKWIHRRNELLDKSWSNGFMHDFSELFIPIEFTNDRMIMIKQLISSSDTSGVVNWYVEPIDVNEVNVNMLDDDEFMFNSVSMNGKTLGYASARIRNNYLICKTALENNLIQYDCVLNRDALALFQRQRVEFQDFNGKSESECVEIIEHAIREGMEINMRWLPERILSCKKCALLLVSKFDCLQYFSNELRDDIDVVTISCLVSKSISFASERIRSNKELVMGLLDQIPRNPDGCNILRYCSAELRDDNELVRKAIKSCTLQICYASQRLQSDFDLLLEVLDLSKEEYKSNGWNEFVFFNSLASRNSIVCSNKCLLLKALENNSTMYEFASRELKNDPQVMEMATRHGNKCCIEHIPLNHPLKSDHDFITNMIKQNGTSIRYFDLSVKSNPDYCMKAIKQNGQSLRHVCNPTFEMRVEAVKQNGYCEYGYRFKSMFKELYKIRMECEYGSLYIPSHLVASEEKPVQYLCISKSSRIQPYPCELYSDWDSTFDYSFNYE